MIANFQTTKYTRGTMLIEVMIYVALFSIMIGGSVVVAYQMFASSGRSGTEAMLEQDGEFILSKIEWALSSADDVILPAPPSMLACTSSHLLTILSSKPTIGLMVLDSALGTLSLSRHGGTPVQLTHDIHVDHFTLTRCVREKHLADERLDISFSLSARTPNGVLVSKDFRSSTDL